MATTTLAGDGLTLTADVYGDEGASPVVLLHGGGQTRHARGTTARVLGDKGWCSYSVELRGHGDSEWAGDGDYSLEAFARDVEELATSFDKLPALVGASLVGISSLTAISDKP